MYFILLFYFILPYFIILFIIYLFYILLFYFVLFHFLTFIYLFRTKTQGCARSKVKNQKRTPQGGCRTRRRSRTEKISQRKEQLEGDPTAGEAM